MHAHMHVLTLLAFRQYANWYTVGDIVDAFNDDGFWYICTCKRSAKTSFRHVFRGALLLRVKKVPKQSAGSQARPFARCPADWHEHIVSKILYVRVKTLKLTT